MGKFSIGKWPALIVAVVLFPLQVSGTTEAGAKIAMEKGAIRYFRENAHPVTGMIRDVADNFAPTPATNRVASIAAVGFGLTVISNAATRNLVPRAEAYRYVLRALKFSRDHVARRKGWFIHWVDWETGDRVWNSEYSTIDTALFIAGALYAAEVFPHSEVARIADRLYRDLDFAEFLTDGGAKPEKRTLSMAYTDGQGFTPSQWDMYAEQMVLLLLGLGHPTQPLPVEVWKSWSREKSPLPEAQALMGYELPLFVHQYSQAFIDFRHFRDGQGNYFDNSVAMTRLHKRMARSEPYKTFKAGFWGLSAGQAPSGYSVANPVHHAGTVCVGCVLASAMFDAHLVLGDAAKWMDGPFRRQLWGRYGFVDSLDLDNDWFSTQVLGITVGPAYMGLVNTDERTSIWHLFMNNPYIRAGMARVGAQ